MARYSSSISGFILWFLLFHGCTERTKPLQIPTEKKYTVVEEARVGSIDGAEEHLFANIAYAVVGKDDCFIVADSELRIIRMYDHNGKFIKTIGQPGRGPGEYLFFGGMKSFPDGSFAFLDQRNGRISFYSPDGEPLRDIVFPPNFMDDMFQVDTDGNFYVKKTKPRTRRTNERDYVWVKVSRTGELLDSTIVPKGNLPQRTSFVIDTPSGRLRPFDDQFISTMSNNGYLLTGYNQDYSITLHRDSDSVSIIRDYNPVPLHPEEFEWWEKASNGFARHGAENVLPKVKPAFRQLLTDSQGRIWVWRYVKAQYTENYVYGRPYPGYWEKPTFDIFLQDGSFYGSVELPFHTLFMDARDDKIWAILMGDQGEEYVVRFKMVPTSS